jgi:hypothetical protein
MAPLIKPQRFREATDEEMDAAYNAVHSDIQEAINALVPWLWRGKALSEVDSPRGRKLLFGFIDKALDAAEIVRMRNAK